MKDYYVVLGIPQTADLNDIKKAFRKLAREWHPDTNSHKPNAEEKFKEINEAYQVLSDDSKKGPYDRSMGYASPSANTYTRSLDQLIFFDPDRVVIPTLSLTQTYKLTIKVTWIPPVMVEPFTKFLVDWEGSSPRWATDLEMLPFAGQDRVDMSFDITAFDAGVGRHSGTLVFLVADTNTDEYLTTHRLVISFEVSKTDNLVVGLQSDGPIRVGPLEVGEKSSVNTTLTNSGMRLWEHPTVQWANGKPFWAGDIRVSKVEGKIFPLGISFDIDTKDCDPAHSPYQEAIEVRGNGVVIGILQVLLLVKKVPVPHIVLTPIREDLGELLWAQSTFYSIRVDNHGDPPKAPLSVSISPYHSYNGGWLSLEGVYPPDAITFPKEIRLLVQPWKVAEGDYVGTVTVEVAGQKTVVQLSARMCPKPIITVSPQNVELEVKGWLVRSGNASVVVNFQGDSVPRVEARWNYEDEFSSVTLGRHSPGGVEFNLIFNLKDYRRRDYRNTLDITICDTQGNTIESLRVPVRVTATWNSR